MMPIFERLRLVPRLVLAFGLVLLVMSTGAVLGMWRLQSLEAVADELGGNATQRALLARELQAIVVLSASRAETLLQIDDPAFAARIDADRKLTSARSEVVRKTLDALSNTEKSKQLFAEIDRSGDIFRTLRNGLVKRKAAGEKIGSDVIQGTLRPAADAYAHAVEELAAYQKQLVDEDRARASMSAHHGILLLALAMGSGTLLSLWCAWALSRSIVKPLKQASELAERVAAGDLRPPQQQGLGRDEVQRLVADLRTMQARLAELVAGVHRVSEFIGVASSEIASGNQDLSSRTEQTSANLQQTASSMAQLTATVHQSAESARLANELAASASTAASEGGAVVAKVVATMEDIAGASKRIANIIGVIDGIAFQTNILALNAAVEAARAGEQGRGFAVVAGEVRSLAQRSATAAKEIKGLIDRSEATVAAGSVFVKEAGASMAAIVASVHSVSEMIREISAATREQSDGIGEVNQAVTELDRMTQQNAALVEESTAATEGLKAQAGLLAEVVGAFRLAA